MATPSPFIFTKQEQTVINNNAPIINVTSALAELDAMSSRISQIKELIINLNSSLTYANNRTNTPAPQDASTIKYDTVVGSVETIDLTESAPSAEDIKARRLEQMQAAQAPEDKVVEPAVSDEEAKKQELRDRMKKARESRAKNLAKK